MFSEATETPLGPEQTVKKIKRDDSLPPSVDNQQSGQGVAFAKPSFPGNFRDTRRRKLTESPGNYRDYDSDDEYDKLGTSNVFPSRRGTGENGQNFLKNLVENTNRKFENTKEEPARVVLQQRPFARRLDRPANANGKRLVETFNSRRKRPADDEENETNPNNDSDYSTQSSKRLRPEKSFNEYRSLQRKPRETTNLTTENATQLPPTTGQANTENVLSANKEEKGGKVVEKESGRKKPFDPDSLEEITAPPENAFKTKSNLTLPQQPPDQPGNKNRVRPDDDFDLQEVELVNSSKVDPKVTQKIDDSLLRKQQKAQMIGTQIPLATSYEYNRSAHVLEPKFDSPKVLGGIIQTLTDKESRLRRMEKRRLKIQHDLTLYISKESANVVNMLNNGEVNKLRKMHPLVYMRLQEVFQTQHALDSLVKKDGDKVKRYDKSWYLNSPPTTKASFIEEIRKYSKDPELYGKFKKPKKIKQSRERIYKKLEIFHNDYICQRVVRENQYATKILRSLEQQSGLYLAPYYHNIVPGLGNLWLIKNFERYYMDAVRSKATTFSKLAPTLVGRFMLMVENGTILPSTPSSQVAIHSLSIMLSLIMDGVNDPKMFLGKKKFYGFMSLCDHACADKIFEGTEAGKKNYLTSRQIEFLKWVFTFHTEDLLLVDTYAQKILLSIMYNVTREDIYRSSPRNVQLRIQSEFSPPKRGRGRESFLELDDKGSERSLLELESGLTSNREKKLMEENRRLLEQHGEKRRQEYRKRQLEKVLEQQRREVQRQREENESEVFQRAMNEREKVLKRAQLQENSSKRDGDDSRGTLFVKQEPDLYERQVKEEKEKEKEMKDKSVYENMKSKLDNLGGSYKLFLNRFMTGYHAPGKAVDPEGNSQTIVPFHVFVPFNKPTGGYDNQLLDVIETITDLVNLANRDSNAYFQSLNSLILIRTMHLALNSFESSKTKRAVSSKTLGALFRWLNTDSNRYLSYVPKKYLPFTSLSLQLVFFFQELVENYTNKVTSSLKSFFREFAKNDFGITIKRPRSFSRLNQNLKPHVVYQSSRYKATLDSIKEVVDLFKETFLSKPSIPSPIIQYLTVFTGLWAQSDSETFNLTERGVHKAKKMFFLSFLTNEKSLADYATNMVLKNCSGLTMLHLGCISRVSSENKECDQVSIPLKKSKILHVMRIIEATSLDLLDVIKVASDTCRRCAANLNVRTKVGAPTMSMIELSESGDLESTGESASEVESEKTPNNKGEGKEGTVDNNKPWYDVFTKNPFKKELSPEEQAMLIPHFTDRLMLHSEITQKIHCYRTQKELVESLLKSLSSAKDEVDARQIITNVFAEYRTIEVIQSGMGSSIYRLICPFMMDAPDNLRLPYQTNIISYVVKKLASKLTHDILLKDLFSGLKSKVDLLIPNPESFNNLTDLPGCVLVGSRKYNGVYFAGGYAPFGKIDKPTNILLKPGEGRLVYDGDNFVPELTALSDVTDLESINVVHERDFDRIVYRVRGEKTSVMLTERAFALEYPNFVVRAHVLITASALIRMGFDMGRIIWCGDRYGWVADFVLNDVVPLSDVPVYNGQYWLLTSQLNVRDVVGSVPIRVVYKNYEKAKSSAEQEEDEVQLGSRPVGGINIEITARGKKVGKVRAHGSGVGEEAESSDDEPNETDLLVGSGGDNLSATPGAVKSVKSATFNPSSQTLTLDLDMPDFVLGH